MLWCSRFTDFLYWNTSNQVHMNLIPTSCQLDFNVFSHREFPTHLHLISTQFHYKTGFKWWPCISFNKYLPLHTIIYIIFTDVCRFSTLLEPILPTNMAVYGHYFHIRTKTHVRSTAMCPPEYMPSHLPSMSLSHGQCKVKFPFD